MARLALTPLTRSRQANIRRRTGIIRHLALKRKAARCNLARSTHTSPKPVKISGPESGLHFPLIEGCRWPFLLPLTYNNNGKVCDASGIFWGWGQDMGLHASIIVTAIKPSPNPSDLLRVPQEEPRDCFEPSLEETKALGCYGLSESEYWECNIVVEPPSDDEQDQIDHWQVEDEDDWVLIGN